MIGQNDVERKTELFGTKLATCAVETRGTLAYRCFGTCRTVLKTLSSVLAATLTEAIEFQMVIEVEAVGHTLFVMNLAEAKMSIIEEARHCRCFSLAWHVIVLDSTKKMKVKDSFIEQFTDVLTTVCWNERFDEGH